MEEFYFEKPSISRKEDAINYIKEHHEYQSKVHGSGGLNRFVDDYEGWLEKLEKDYHHEVTERIVPAKTYFLIRRSDDRIIGMSNLRLALTEGLKRVGGHIGYGIRPTERGNGYNKINLYLALKEFQKEGIDEILLDANIDNPASWRTMEALGGQRIQTFHDEKEGECYKYKIDVQKSLGEYGPFYEELIHTQRSK